MSDLSIPEMVEALLDLEAENLTTWEREFLHDWRIRARRGREMSTEVELKIREIWDEVVEVKDEPS